MLDGFKLDSCSTGHTLIQTNPLLSADELGLVADHGLSYIAPDPVAHVVFPDGESSDDVAGPGAHLRGDRALLPRDAEAYRRMLAEYDAVKEAFNRSRFTPVGFGPSLDQMLEASPARRAGADGRR